MSLAGKALEPVSHSPDQFVLPDFIAKASNVCLKSNGLGPVKDHLVSPQRERRRFVGCGQQVVPGFQPLLVPFDMVQAHLNLVKGDLDRGIRIIPVRLDIVGRPKDRNYLVYWTCGTCPQE